MPTTPLNPVGIPELPVNETTVPSDLRARLGLIATIPFRLGGIAEVSPPQAVIVPSFFKAKLQAPTAIATTPFNPVGTVFEEPQATTVPSLFKARL